MRQFKLWNAAMTASFDFKTEGCLISDVAGLGINYNLTLKENAVIGYVNEFPDVSLTVNFGIRTNPYAAFNSLAAFIAANGKTNLVLEYEVNGRTVYADVWVKSLPKSQKTNFGVLTETLVFARLTFWYTIEEGVIPTAPLTITNAVDDDLQLKVTIRASTPADFRIIVKENGVTVSQVIIPSQLIAGTLTTDPEHKSVLRDTAGSVTNGYNLISREGDTFLVLGKGTYTINTNAAVTNPPLYRYKKWVVD